MYLLFLIMRMPIAMCEYVHMSVGAHKGQMRALDPLELDLQVVLSHQTWY